MSFVGNSAVDLVAVIGVSCGSPARTTRPPCGSWCGGSPGRPSPGGPARPRCSARSPGGPVGGSTTSPASTPRSSGSPPARPSRWTRSSGSPWRLTHHAFESAGLDARGAGGSRTGVFIGTIWNDYSLLLDARGPDHHDLTGVARCIVANRISYLFGLRGPSMVVDTGQSSSLVAVHLAAESLRNGEARHRRRRRGEPDPHLVESPPS